MKKPVSSRENGQKNGAKNGTRTRDGQIHNLELYQLSYFRHRKWVTERDVKKKTKGNGSGGRIRTSDQVVNSHLLYR